jgi:hypothetical protein
LHSFAEPCLIKTLKDRDPTRLNSLISGVKRLLKRMAFRIVDNPVTIAALKLVGATRGKRSRITDFYFLVFRRNSLAGYYQAKREARAGRPLIVNTPRSECADK